VDDKLEMIWKWPGLNFKKCTGEGLRKTRKPMVGVAGVPAEAGTGHLQNRIQKGTCSSESNYTLIHTVLVVTAHT
jgi:hypothetical protein